MANRARRGAARARDCAARRTRTQRLTRWYAAATRHGSPLGSARRVPGSIDSIARGRCCPVGDPRRARLAMRFLASIHSRPNGCRCCSHRRSTVRRRIRYIKAYSPESARERRPILPPRCGRSGRRSARRRDRAAQLFADLLPIGRAATKESAAVPGRALRHGCRYLQLRCAPVAAVDLVHGSAGWAYRFAWEMLLGLIRFDGWRIDPALPSHWPMRATPRDGSRRMRRHRPTARRRARRRRGPPRRRAARGLIPRLRDGGTHRVSVVCGSRKAGRLAVEPRTHNYLRAAECHTAGLARGESGSADRASTCGSRPVDRFAARSTSPPSSNAISAMSRLT